MKENKTSLAITGGLAAVTQKVTVWPFIVEQDIERMTGVMMLLQVLCSWT